MGDDGGGEEAEFGLEGGDADVDAFQDEGFAGFVGCEVGGETLLLWRWY